MSAYVAVGITSTSNIAEAIYSVLRMQPPEVSTVVGLCITSDLTATSKISLYAGLQLSVALAMVVVYLFGTMGQACCRFKSVKVGLPREDGSLVSTLPCRLHAGPVCPSILRPLFLEQGCFGCRKRSKSLREGPARKQPTHLKSVTFNFGPSEETESACSWCIVALT
jgi:hypothetical protein